MIKKYENRGGEIWIHEDGQSWELGGASIAERLNNLETELAEATDQIGRAEMSEQTAWSTFKDVVMDRDAKHERINKLEATLLKAQEFIDRSDGNESTWKISSDIDDALIIEESDAVEIRSFWLVQSGHWYSSEQLADDGRPHPNQIRAFALIGKDIKRKIIAHEQDA